MAEARHRTRSIGHNTGTQTIYGSVYTYARDNGYESIDDEIGNYLDHGLWLIRKKVTGGLINGELSNPWEGTWASWNNFPYDVQIGIGPPAPLYSTDDGKLHSLAMTNPSRHETNVPAFLAELRDLPKMLRLAGRLKYFGEAFLQRLKQAWDIRNREFPTWSYDQAPDFEWFVKYLRSHLTKQMKLPEDGLSYAQIFAAANLAWQFGWAPIIRDLQKMVGFQEAVARRRKEINQLYSGLGLKRKFVLQDDSNEVSVNGYTIASVAGVIDGTAHGYARRRMWTTTRYKPIHPSLLPPTDTRLIQQIYGLTVHGVAAGAWEVLPWSWLIGWFSNVGDFIAAGNNEMDVVISSMLLMEHVETIISFPGGSATFGDGTKSYSTYRSVQETKSRSAGPPGPGALAFKLPVLTGNQLSILGSLALLRGR